MVTGPRQRRELLDELLNRRRETAVILSELLSFAWDAEAIAEVNGAHVESILRRYLEEELDAEEVEAWANAVECREDIAFETEQIKELVWELANPMLAQPISQLTAQQWIARAKERSTG